MPDLNAWWRENSPKVLKQSVGYAELLDIPESDMPLPDTTEF